MVSFPLDTLILAKKFLANAKQRELLNVSNEKIGPGSIPQDDALDAETFADDAGIPWCK